MRTHEKFYECNDFQHPFIVRYDAAFEDGGNMYLQMEYFAHGSLRHWIETAKPDARAKRSLLRQVLLGMACIHSQKIVHCDIKGGNVLVANDGTPRICDFEMSKDLDAALSSTMVGGTRGFMAPKSFRGSPNRQSLAICLHLASWSPIMCEPELSLPSYQSFEGDRPSAERASPRLLSRYPSSRATAAQLLAERYFASNTVDEWGRVDVGQLVSGKAAGKRCSMQMLAL